MDAVDIQMISEYQHIETVEQEYKRALIETLGRVALGSSTSETKRSMLTLTRPAFMTIVAPVFAVLQDSRLC